MTPTPPKPVSRCVGKAVWLLLGVYIIGIFTGIGGGMLVIQHKARQVFRGSGEARGAIDFVFAKVESDLARDARLTPDERAVLHERMGALAREFKQSRLRLAGELRASIVREMDTVEERVDASRREALHGSIRKHIDRWGLGLGDATPGPTK